MEQNNQTPQNNPLPPKNNNKIFLPVLVAALITSLLVGSGVYFWQQNKVNKQLEKSEKVKAENTLLAKQLEKLQNNKEEDQGDLIARCGDLPPDSELGIDYGGHFTKITGPFWSSDCRNIAWSVRESGVMGVENNGPYSFEGLFIFSDSSRKTTKIYTPKKEEAVGLVGWTDRNSLIFSASYVRYKYDLLTGKISTIEE